MHRTTVIDTLSTTSNPLPPPIHEMLDAEANHNFPSSNCTSTTKYLINRHKKCFKYERKKMNDHHARLPLDSLTISHCWPVLTPRHVSILQL